MARSDDANLPPFASAVRITTLDGFSSYLGSGALIDSEWVLTTAHIVARKSDGNPLPEEQVHIRVDSNDKNGLLEVEKLFINSEYTYAPGDAQTYKGYSKLHASENILDRVGAFEHIDSIFGVDFDSPDGKTNALAGNFPSSMEDILEEGTSQDTPLELKATQEAHN